MPPSKRYALTSKEMHLRLQLAEATARAEQLTSDTSGAKRIAALEEKAARLEAKLKDESILRTKIADLSFENKSLKATIKEQRGEIVRLKADLAYAYERERDAKKEAKRCEKARFGWAKKARELTFALSEALAKNRRLKVKLNRSPQNSSMPPSSNPNTKKTICNSREKTGKKPGGQFGHEGHKRRARTPDETVYLDAPDACPDCGGTLMLDDTFRKRQVSDVVVTVVTTEYVSAGHVCTCCGKQLHAPFPEGVVNEANYGNNLRAITTFLANSCNVSINKVASFIYEATGHELKLSEGSVCNFLSKFSKKAQGAIDDIKSAIGAAGVIGADATHTRCEGKQSYIYNFNNQNSSFYQPSTCKGLKPLENSLLANYRGTIVHDHDISYYSFGTAHAECNVHPLRYLKGICQNEPGKAWAPEMRALLCEANSLCKAARNAGADALDDNTIAGIEARFDAIIATAENEYADVASLPAKYRPEGVALYKRLKEFKCNHLAFIHDLSIPFDNNRSERNLRCVKSKTKQSGGFRSTQGGEAPYCDYLSVAKTATLRDMAVLGTVHDIFDGKTTMFKAERPPPT